MASGSRSVVIAALIGNLVIAILKLVVALITFSSAMLAEAVHSFADKGNQVLLLFGMHRSRRPGGGARGQELISVEFLRNSTQEARLDHQLVSTLTHRYKLFQLDRF